MTISSGFFNSVNHDRLYDAEQFSSIFDGIINDGVYESFGDAFSVTPNSSVNDSVIVGTGRAWFDHTWTYNDAQFSLTLEPPNLVASRIDAIVIDVDRRDSVRNNSIIVVQGTPAQDPQKPSMISEELHSQYPIAYVTVPPGNSEPISSSNIEYNVGKSSCPLVTGPLEVINSDNFFAQMDSNFEDFKNELDAEWTTWFDGIKDLIDDLQIGNINLVNSVDNVTIEWPSETKKLQVKDRGITRDKLSFDLQSIIGVLDPSNWSYQDYYDYTSSLTSSVEEETFTSQYLTSSVVSNWTSEQISSYYDILKSNSSKDTLWNGIDWLNQPLSGFRSLVEKFGSSKYSSMIGKKIKIDLGNTYGVHNFIVIGVNHDTLVSGGTALLTFQSEDIVSSYSGLFEIPTDARFTGTPIYTEIQNIFSEADSSVTNLIKEVLKYQFYGSQQPGSSYWFPGKEGYHSKYWIASATEVGATSQPSFDLGTIYDYWSSRKGTPSNYIKQYQGVNTGWGTSYDETLASSGQQNDRPNRANYNGCNETGVASDTQFRFGTDYSSNPVGDTHKEVILGVNQTVYYYHVMYLVPCFCV